MSKQWSGEDWQAAANSLQPHASYDPGRFGAIVSFDYAMELKMENTEAVGIIDEALRDEHMDGSTSGATLSRMRSFLARNGGTK